MKIRDFVDQETIRPSEKEADRLRRLSELKELKVEQDEKRKEKKDGKI